jgi:hydrogenase maturation protease
VTEATPRVLVLGFGNPGRLDDGLGPSLAARLESLDLPQVTVDANYQLGIEDAAEVATHDVVVFADAATRGPEPFYFEALEPTPYLSFSSHSVSPGALLALARDLFEARTQAWVLGIRGYEFNEFGERLSEQARRNLDAAYDFLVKSLREGRFEPHPAGVAGTPAHAEGENTP